MTAARNPDEEKAAVAAVFELGAPDDDQQGVEFSAPLGRWLIDTVAPAPCRVVVSEEATIWTGMSGHGFDPAAPRPDL